MITRTTDKISSIRTVGTFLKGRACSDALFHVINREFGQALISEERAAMPLAGGIMRHGYQCGMIWGAALAAGAQAYRLQGSCPQAETKAILAAQRLVAAFRAHHQTINCLDITDIDTTSSTMQMVDYFLIKGGGIDCIRMAANFASAAFSEIKTALCEQHIQAPDTSLGCAAVLARKMGASDMHTVMAAGFAGGIGLSGGACGALGAAIWINGTKSSTEKGAKIDFKNPRALDAMDRFLTCTGYEFECCDIVGRKFTSIEDHADYIGHGGCSAIIETLSAG